MIWPTPLTLGALGVASLFLILGVITSLAVDLVAAVDGLIIALFVIDAWRTPSPKKIGCERISPIGFSAGRPSSVVYRWNNRTTRPAVLTILELRPTILGGLQPKRQVLIPADATIADEQPVMPIHRGQETSGWLAVRSTGPWGLAVKQHTRDQVWEVLVLPTIPASRLKTSLAEAMKRREAGLRSARVLGAGRTFESLREWVPGDDTRHIDWKASARRRKPILRQYEDERRQQVLLVLDVGRLLTAEIEGVPRIEYAVNAALELAIAASRNGDNVGVMVFADTVKHFVSPQKGRSGLKQVIEVLARIEPVLVEPDYPGAFRYLAAYNRKRSLTVVFTDVIDARASQAMVAQARSLSRRHLPVAVTIRNPALDRTATMRPDNPKDAYRKAAAEELLFARNSALAQMRGSGTIVLDVPPENATLAIVRTYGELKRRGRL